MTGLLSIESVSKGYSRGSEWEPVLADVVLEVMSGEIVAVIGGRLEGKTTLMRIAAGLEPPDSGTVSFEGGALADLPGRSGAVRWIDRSGLGMDAEVSELVGWPLASRVGGRRSAEAAAAQMLRRVGADGCAGLRWGDLSNWQRVLVGLARTFVGNPRLVIFDDLLDALGEPATERAFDLLRSLVEATGPPRCGVLMSASSMESAMFADRVLSITGKRSLTTLSGRLTDEGEVVPLARRTRAGGS